MGDWKGCIESLTKKDKSPQYGVFFAAMAHWQLGDKTRLVSCSIDPLVVERVRGTLEQRLKEKGTIPYPGPG